MIRRLAAVILLVLAGCSGLPAPGSETPTLTPVPVPATDTPVPPEEVHTPGPDDAGVTRPERLADAHRESLAGRSFTVDWRRSVVGANGTLAQWHRRLRVGAGGTRYHYRRTFQRTPGYPVSVYRPHLEEWYDGDAVYVRGLRDGEELFARQREDTLGDVTQSPRLRTLFAAFETRAHETDNGTRVIGTRLSDPTMLTPPPLVSQPRDARLVVVLAPDGRVRHYRLTYEATFEDTSPTRGRRFPVRVVETARFRAVGTTTVERPDWYGAAKNATER